MAIPIVGAGYINKCPTAVATAQVGDSLLFTNELEGVPMGELKLSAAGSSDPDGDDIAGFQWEIVEAPYGYAQRLMPSSSEKFPTVQLTLVGDYVFELNVVDANGMESCVGSQVHVSIVPNSDLIIELVWRTPSDLDETDTCMGCGTDLDLHFKRPGGIWDDKFGHSDCHFRSTRADMNTWGAVGSDDNPGLARDDVDGGGPEQIYISHPAYTDGSQPSGYSEPYEVGVYFYQNWNFQSPVMAHLNIYLNRSLEPLMVPLMPEGIEQAMSLTVSDASPAAMGHFWLAGTIDWDADGGHFTQTPPESQPMIGFPN